MKLRRNFGQENETGDINVSPLIDVVFILLIFFIVSATFVTLPGIQVNRPKVRTSTALEKNSVLLLYQKKPDSLFRKSHSIIRCPKIDRDG